MTIKIPDSFLALTYTFKSCVNKEIREVGIDIAPMEIQSLHCINRIDSCTAAYISEQLDRDKGQVARLVRDMLKKDLIYKVSNPSDSRSQLIELSEFGQEVLKQLLHIESGIMKVMLDSITENQVDQFNAIALAMTKNLKR
ncbi:MarR family transcriptional regulator [Shewanella sp. Choline-02u-19]|uniref:MarR family winged helix-turn-helix transcriptional regulator n=1 Tax=unclassified Shewanella TaxID=196818 RepID=UPI000C32EE2B|nr:MULTISPECIES: MarR family transcriptional regulator [unclassified Shewanella]PKH57370.1 MarR family transcriptional regulator [Shewanella sp. Bg11-22]PKI28329.1 MarR family transcriptional regulator [Shewanella sp. Choline-02u-19]